MDCAIFGPIRNFGSTCAFIFSVPYMKYFLNRGGWSCFEWSLVEPSASPIRFPLAISNIANLTISGGLI